MRVAAAVDAVDGAHRSAGPGVLIATQYPGGRAVGIRFGDDHVVVHIVAERLDVRRIGDEVRRAVGRALAGLAADRAVTVVVDDVAVASPDASNGRCG